MHPNEKLLRESYEARARGDVDEVLATLTEDVVWHVPGRSAISGAYRGRQAVIDYIRRRQELAGGTFRIEVHDVLANDDNGVVIASGRASRNARDWTWRGHALYSFFGGKIKECRLLPEDLYLFDEIWGRDP